jgi:hypothetical protein
MGEMEDRGYVPMSRTEANYAFYMPGEIDRAWVNLWWLADVIRSYEAGTSRPADPATMTELQQRARLEILRPAVKKLAQEAP